MFLKERGLLAWRPKEYPISGDLPSSGLTVAWRWVSKILTALVLAAAEKGARGKDNYAYDSIAGLRATILKQAEPK